MKTTTIDLENFKPLNNHILLKRDPSGGKIGLIHIPETQYHDSKWCTVISKGPGKLVNGKRIPIDVEVGDRVIVLAFDGEKIDETNDGSLIVVTEDLIVAKLSKDEVTAGIDV